MKRTAIVNPILKARKESTRPLFYVDENRDPAHWGSCTLLRIAHRYFIITAAHELDAWINTSAYLPHNKGFYKLKPLFLFSTPLPHTKNREDDKIDIGYVEVTPSNMPSEIQNAFIDIDDVAVSEHREEKRWYVVVGHPLSKTVSDRKKQKVKVKKPFTFTTIQVAKSVQQRLEFPNDSFLMHFQQKKVFSDDHVRMKAPKPKGISGGAVWELPIIDNKHITDTKEKLVGIIIEHRNKENCLIGTSIKRVIYSLAYHYPDLRDRLTEWLSLEN